MELNNKQIKKVNKHLNIVMDFLTSFFDDDENIQPIKKHLQIIIDTINKK